MDTEKIKKILAAAMVLIEDGTVDCLFKALTISSGDTWKGGSGVPGFQVTFFENGRLIKEHAAYHAVRKLTKVHLMYFSQLYSRHNMVNILLKAMELVSKWKN